MTSLRDEIAVLKARSLQEAHAGHYFGAWPPNGAHMRERADEFAAAGGRIESTAPGPNPVRDKAWRDFAAMEQAMPAAWRNTNASKYMSFAIISGTDKYPGKDTTLLARDGSGDLSAALSYRVDTVESVPGGRVFYIAYLGSAGIAQGAGSAVVRQAVRLAAEQGLPILLYSAASAQKFWRGVGMVKGWPNQEFYGMTAEQVQRAARALVA